MAVRTAPICADCGFPVSNLTPRTQAKGSAVREPGEAVCKSCTSTRVMLLRQLDRLPSNLPQIQAQRMVRA